MKFCRQSLFCKNIEIVGIGKFRILPVFNARSDEYHTVRVFFRFCRFSLQKALLSLALLFGYRLIQSIFQLSDD